MKRGRRCWATSAAAFLLVVVEQATPWWRPPAALYAVLASHLETLLAQARSEGDGLPNFGRV